MAKNKKSIKCNSVKDITIQIIEKLVDLLCENNNRGSLGLESTFLPCTLCAENYNNVRSMIKESNVHSGKKQFY